MKEDLLKKSGVETKKSIWCIIWISRKLFSWNFIEENWTSIFCISILHNWN